MNGIMSRLRPVGTAQFIATLILMVVAYSSVFGLGVLSLLNFGYYAAIANQAQLLIDYPRDEEGKKAEEGLRVWHGVYLEAGKEQPKLVKSFFKVKSGGCRPEELSSRERFLLFLKRNNTWLLFLAYAVMEIFPLIGVLLNVFA